MTADELVAKGKRLSAAGGLVVFLYPSQEWMAVETQTPFLRYEKIPLSPPPWLRSIPPSHKYVGDYMGVPCFETDSLDHRNGMTAHDEP